MLTGLNHITLAVLDLERSLDFYSRLGFSAHVKWDSGAYLSLGELWLCLSVGPVDEKRDYTHLAFSIDEAQFACISDLVLELGTVEWKKNSSDGKSVYMLDPNGHKLEVHTGDLTSRLLSLKDKPYKGLVWL